MIDFRSIKTIFFDYDGTLHNSINIYAPAFKKAYSYLVENGLAEQREVTEKEISHWLGYNSQEMWQAFMPQLPQELRDICSQIVGQEMKRQVETGGSILYEGALQTLEHLKLKGYQLVFISNCRIYYRDAHNRHFELDKYFESLVCSEEYDFIPKHEILGRIKNSYPEKMVIVGDRAQDIEAGIKNGIFTIGCSYGFAAENELKDADLIIDNINELREYL